jgi:hypothetical protein
MAKNTNWRNQPRDPRTGRFTKGSGSTRPKRISAQEEARQDQIAVPHTVGVEPPKGLSGAKLAKWYLQNEPVVGGKPKLAPRMKTPKR